MPTRLPPAAAAENEASAPAEPAIIAIEKRLRELTEKAGAAWADVAGKKGDDYAVAIKRHRGIANVRDRVEAQFRAAGGTKAVKAALDAARRAAEAATPDIGESDDWHYLGRVFAREFSGRVALVEGVWGAWCGTHWDFSEVSAAYDFASGFLAHRGTEKVRTMKGAPRELLDRAAHGLTRKRDEFDAPRVSHLMSVANGTVDLRTSELLPHNPEDLITAYCPVRPTPRSRPPRSFPGWASRRASRTPSNSACLSASYLCCGSGWGGLQWTPRRIVPG